MTEERPPLAELLAKARDGDFLRSVAEAVVQLLMETDVEGLIGAGRHERSGERTTYRNGYRDRTLDTWLGARQLRIPKLRQGNYFPPFLEPRKTSEKALVAVIQEAWVGGVSTRRVDDLVQAMGLAGISKSTVSKLCKDIDDRVNAFLEGTVNLFDPERDDLRGNAGHTDRHAAAATPLISAHVRKACVRTARYWAAGT